MATQITIDNEILLPFAEPDKVKDSYLDTIKTFLSDPARVAFMKDAYNLKGGWEVWLQVEAAVALRRQLGGVAVISREEQIWDDSSDKVDLWIKDGPVGAPKYVAGFEFKCQNLNSKSQNTAQGIPAKMMEDVEKCGNVLKPVTKPDPSDSKKTVNVPAYMYAMAFTRNPYDLRHSYNSTADGGLKRFYKWGKRTDIKWCYLYQQAGLTVEKDTAIQDKGSINVPAPQDNLYLIWYKQA